MFDLIAFDADDTLWHNESLYEQSQARLKGLLAGYADGETVVKRLYETEMRNLDCYGYGVKSFTLSMIETAIELSEGKISGSQIQKIIGFAKDMLTARVQLLEHVAETLDVLSGSYSLMVITKGDLRDQRSKLSQSGIKDYFQHVEIVSHKNEETYAALLKKYEVIPQRFLMVGNSLRSDILPVIAIGGQAVHIPYHITWQHEIVESFHVDKNGYYELEHLGQLPQLLEQMNGPISTT
jgi:putative hydrolase of the HAD superfamily